MKLKEIPEEISIEKIIAEERSKFEFKEPKFSKYVEKKTEKCIKEILFELKLEVKELCNYFKNLADSDEYKEFKKRKIYPEQYDMIIALLIKYNYNMSRVGRYFGQKRENIRQKCEKINNKFRNFDANLEELVNVKKLKEGIDFAIKYIQNECVFDDGLKSFETTRTVFYARMKLVKEKYPDLKSHLKFEKGNAKQRKKQVVNEVREIYLMKNGTNKY